MKLSTFAAALAACTLLSAPAARAFELIEPTTCYLMHSSGNHLAKSAENKAVLEAPDAAEPMQVTITPLGEGVYNISAPDGTFLARSGNWNTTFLADGTSNDAKFTIEDNSNYTLRIRCKGNNKCLGTDNGNAGSSVFSDKSGTDANHGWYISDTPTGKLPTGDANYVINPSALRQSVEGWGVSLCWWANVAGGWSDEKIDEVVDWLVSPQGLNYNIFRYNIGGGDDPENKNCTPHHMGNGKGLRAEMEGFKDSSDGDYIWTRDETQRKIMLKIKEKRPDAIFEAFSNSAPWYMTYSGCVAGNSPSSKDNLKPEYYEEFAHYLVDVCKHYKDEYGIEFRTLDPFNEPMTDYWGCNGGQEGCHFDVSSQIAFLKVLHPILQASGLKTVISASDETSVAQSVTDFKAYAEAGVLDMVGQWNTHTYTANDKARAQIDALCHEKGMRLWQSETGSGGTGIAGNLGMAQKLMNDVKLIRPAAWLDWQYIEDNDQWCLVRWDITKRVPSYKKVKNYYIRSHFSRFIQPGYTYLTCLNKEVMAAQSPERDKVVIVAMNRNSNAMRHHVDMSIYNTVGAPTACFTDQDNDMAVMTVDLRGKVLHFELPPMSIATIEVPVTTDAVAEGELAEGKDYLIYPRMGTEVALAAEDEAVKVNAVNYGKEQLWQVKASGDGYTLTNAAGDIITSDENYPLKVSTTTAEGQSFKITRLPDGYYSIKDAADRGFDLEGEATQPGTAVGMWNYDAASQPAHRQWNFISVPMAPDFSSVEAIASQGSDLDVRINEGDGVSVTGEGTVRVYSMAGVILYEGYVNGDTMQIPLQRGIYIVALTGADGSVKARKLSI